MRDVHSHILPGLDNGPRTMSESLLMLSAAMQVGVTSIVCTPHCHDSRFRFEPAWQAFLQLKHRASAIPGAPQLTMGFEVGYHKLKSLGMEAAPQLGNGFGEFLLELPTGALPLDWPYMVRQLQQMGFKVIIAHPERCKEVQSDIEMARRFVNAGCELQIAAVNIQAGFFRAERRTALKLVQAGLVTHVASEAHDVEDYELFAEARELYGIPEPEQPQLLRREAQPVTGGGKQAYQRALAQAQQQRGERSHAVGQVPAQAQPAQPADARPMHGQAAPAANQGQWAADRQPQMAFQSQRPHASSQDQQPQPEYSLLPKRGKHAR